MPTQIFEFMAASVELLSLQSYKSLSHPTHEIHPNLKSSFSLNPEFVFAQSSDGLHSSFFLCQAAHFPDSPKDVGTVLTDLGGVASGVSGGLRHPYSPKGMVLGVGENERMFRALKCCRDISFFLVLPFIHLPGEGKLYRKFETSNECKGVGFIE
ncbi:unnamed protein product [Microthlaspi erraticum]|uniref:Uncharacterized protein n=1 Tax=Microthlaspi erraticum TaxID=1685480 RepID=A0A6D2HZU6_9BRAS|nr:unnamed protein product [Microthlaspi erraticum]